MNCFNKSIALVVMVFASQSIASTKILVFGDFGSGDNNQRLVADDMVNFCKARQCDFAVTVGDNIYPRGIENFLNGKLDYFGGKPNWENVKKLFVDNYAPLNIPIYMTYGNHDVGNDGVEHVFKDLLTKRAEINKRTQELMRNQINFTQHEYNPQLKDSSGQIARLWTFPAPFYKKIEKGDVHLFAIDTNAYPHAALNSNKELNINNEKNYEQQAWLASNLKTNATWKVVFGHVPLITHGQHGWLDFWVVKEFNENIIDTLCENRVDFYLSGHDHHLEIDKIRCKNGHILTSILSGAAGKQTRIFQRTFPVISDDENLLWANGKHYTGSKLIFHNDDYVYGFSYIEIENNNTATIRMKLSDGASKSRADGCFRLTKGKSIVKITCP